MKRMRWILLPTVLAVLFCCVAIIGSEPRSERPRYIILLIGDGMGSGQRRLPELVTGLALTLNRLPVSAVTNTCNVLGGVTDSAAGGTAIAGGAKTRNFVVGLNGDLQRLESVATVACRAGKKVGLITSSAINDATPAAFFGHQKHRKMYEELNRDMVASNFDVLVGKSILGNQKQALEDMRQAGYNIVYSPEDIHYGGKTLALIDTAADFSCLKRGMLAEVLRYTLRALDNPQGFFVMVEGGIIDHGGHNNDAALIVREMLEFDMAVSAALDFLETHPNDTLVVVTADHETGGLTTERVILQQVDGIMRQKKTCLEISKLVAATTDVERKQIEKIIRENLAIDFVLTADEKMKVKEAWGKFIGKEDDIADSEKEALTQGTGKILGRKDSLSVRSRNLVRTWSAVRDARLGICFKSCTHTGADIVTGAAGNGAEYFGSIKENYEIGKLLKKAVSREENWP